MGPLHGYKCSSASLSHKSSVKDLQSYDPIVQKIYGRLRPISYSCVLHPHACVLSWSQCSFSSANVLLNRSLKTLQSELAVLLSWRVCCAGKVGQPIYRIKSKASPCIMDVLLLTTHSFGF